MRSRGRAGAALRTESKLSPEDRAFLDFVARLAVEQVLREASAAPSVAACGAGLADQKSSDNGDA